jgi:hypothetical protein
MGSSNSKKDTLDCKTCPLPLEEKDEVEVNTSNGKITLKKDKRYSVNYNNNEYRFTFKYAINNILYFTNVQQMTLRNGVTSSCPLNNVLPNSMLLIADQYIALYEIKEITDVKGGKKKTKKYKYSLFNKTLNKRRKKN